MNRYRSALLVGLALLTLLAIPTVSALENTTIYFVPQDGNSSDCSDTVVKVMAHAPYGVNTLYFAIATSASCIDIVDVTFNSFFPLTQWNDTYQPECWGPGHDWIKVAAFSDAGSGEVWLCDITIRCVDSNCTYCESYMDATCGIDCGACDLIVGNIDGALPFNVTRGTFTCGTGPPSETFSNPLVVGWNLISLPLVPVDNSVDAVLSEVSYDAVYEYDATSKQFEGADVMDPGTGYFVHVIGDCTWTYDGTPHTSMDVSLKQGLNMVGWLNSTKDVAALSSISDYYYVAWWNTAAEKFEVHNPAAPSAFNDFTTMERGTGYFISAKQDCTLVETC